MKAMYYFETPIDFQQTTWRHILEDNANHNPRCENFTCYKTCLAKTHFRKAETTKNHPHQNNSLLGRKSQLSTSNKLLIHETILKPIWTYGIQLWGTASTSNIKILERFQPKGLRRKVDAPWYVPNTYIRRDLQIPTAEEESRRYSFQYSARPSAHPNDLTVNLMELRDKRRLRRHVPNDLPTRFLV
jgi:hypothetical protein